MTPMLRPRRLVAVGALTLIWCGLWGEVTFANAISGFFIGTVVMALGLGTSGHGGIRIIPLMHLLWIVAVDLAKSTVSVAAEIITPGDGTNESVIAVNVAADTRDHLLLLSVAITLTPGTAVVDADPATGTLYLHLLHDETRADTIAHVEKLARVTCEALPAEPRTVST